MVPSASEVAGTPAQLAIIHSSSQSPPQPVLWDLTLFLSLPRGAQGSMDLLSVPSTRLSLSVLISLIGKRREDRPLAQVRHRPHLTHLFLGICRNLKSIVVQIGIADYFKEPSSPEAQKLFEDMVTKLQVSSWL